MTRFLTRVKNPNPFFGALILVALLLNTLFLNLVTIIYIIQDKPYNVNELVYFSVFTLIFVLLSFYAVKRKNQILEVQLSHGLNFFVAGIYLFAILTYIWCANVNREKLSKGKQEIIVQHNKESLEGKIRKLFEQ